VRAPAATSAARSLSGTSPRRVYRPAGAVPTRRGRAATRPVSAPPRVSRPRRLSGPSRGMSGAALALVGSAVALPRTVRPAPSQAPAPAPRRAPRRAPAGRRPPRARPAGGSARASEQAGSDALRALLRVADHTFLDKLIRGRLWVGLVGFALIGIVAMQLVVLRLNTEVGRGLEHKANLEREISSLQVATSSLTDGERIQTEAAHRGMQPGPPGAVQFVSAQPNDARAAAQLLASAAATTGEGSSAVATSGEPHSSTESSAGGEAHSGAEAGAGEASGSPAATSTSAASGASAEAGATGEQAPSEGSSEHGSSATTQPAAGGASAQERAGVGAAGQEAPRG
jgi:hypothetical protein